MPESAEEPQRAPASHRKTFGELQKVPASRKKHRTTDRRVGIPEFRILVARPIRNANGSVTGEREYLVRMAQAEPLCTTIGAFCFADYDTDWWFAIAGGHTASNAPDLFRPPKLSGAGPG